MQNELENMVQQYQQERNALIAEANERMQKHQMETAEHNARIAEIQTRVTQIEGAVQALQNLGKNDQ